LAGVFSSKIQNIKIYSSVNYINTKTLNKTEKQKKQQQKSLLKKDKTSICTNKKTKTKIITTAKKLFF
jgi:hypothetical protein